MSDSSNQAPKVLVIALSGIGNLLMQLPAIQSLKKTHPSWNVTVWVAPRGTKAIAEANPYIDKVIEGPIKHSLFGHIKAISEFGKMNFDIGIVMSPGQLIKSAAYMKFAGIPKRIGHYYPFLGRQTSIFLTDAVKEKQGLHDIEQNINILEPLGIPKPHDRSYSLHIPVEVQKKADEKWQELHIPSGKNIIGIHPGSADNYKWKRWPVENWIKLGQALVNKNAHILIFGGQEEEDIKQHIHASLSNQSTVVASPLLVSAALIRRCNMFISNDSGLMHIAAALGTKTYGLFGPTDEKLTGPKGNNSHVIRAPGTAPSYNTEENTFADTDTHPSMKKITPELVLERILS